jgi:hypothetical protein
MLCVLLFYWTVVCDVCGCLKLKLMLVNNLWMVVNIIFGINLNAHLLQFIYLILFKLLSYTLISKFMWYNLQIDTIQ